MDHESAFLLADLKVEDQCCAKLPNVESKMLIKRDPTKWSKYLNEENAIDILVHSIDS